jgi:hypothetical protein
LGDPLKGNLLLFYKSLHLEAQQVSTRIEVRRHHFFETPELEGRISLLTKSDKSLGSLKEYCTKWNDADFMDTASSRKKKSVEASATGNPAAILAAKPIPIASELLTIQQRLHLLADATNVSILLIYPQSPKMSVVQDTDIQDFQLLT